MLAMIQEGYLEHNGYNSKWIKKIVKHFENEPVSIPEEISVIVPSDENAEE